MNHNNGTGRLAAQLEQAALNRFMSEAWVGEVNYSSRDYVRWVQHSLNKILGLRLAEDGVLGSQTRQAIRTFQLHYGLKADGLVGPQTERALTAAGAGQPRPAIPAPQTQTPLRRDS